MTRKMHEMTPAEHAAMGWAHGQYNGPYCFALSSDDDPEEVEKFKAQAKARGADYVALWRLPEYTP